MMIFGIVTFTLIHTLLSLLGLIAGLVLVGGWLSGKQLEGWSIAFLVTTVLTNVTGFGFPATVVLPSHIVGAISLVVLALVLAARYGMKLEGIWRTLYVAGSVAALYLNIFVLVVQLFRRIPGLIAAAPTQKEPPFAVTQLLVMALFVWIGRRAVQTPRS